MIKNAKGYLLMAAVSVASPCALSAGTDIQNVTVVPDQDATRIDVDLSSPVKPTVRFANHPNRIIVSFPSVLFGGQTRRVRVGKDGIDDVTVQVVRGSSPATNIVVGVDAARPYGIDESDHKFALRILPHPARPTRAASSVSDMAAKSPPGSLPARRVSAAPLLQVEHASAGAEIDEAPADPQSAIRRRFRVKFLAGNTAYIDGGTNEGLRVGMDFDIIRPHAHASSAELNGVAEPPIASAHVVGVAITSAVTEIVMSEGQLKAGDWAELTPQDADLAARNVMGETNNEVRSTASTDESGSESTTPPDVAKNSLRSTRETFPETGARMGGRIGFDYSGISSKGSTPGVSGQLGVSFESDMKQILGTHWNLEGYWRGRINRHSQFQEDTIEETLSKTYTMQLYYDNPNSKWVAGVGRLYLPWAVSLDTVDGGYLGRKSRFGMTSGIFAGSTPDLTSWHYRPDQRIGGAFTNFEGGNYEGFHYSSTAGAALTSIGWKLDRPFIFFENELSYKGNLSMYHSLIVDSPQGVTTNGIKPGTGVSHSYFTLHYQPAHVIALDFYHNYFRDVPTAATTLVGTGLVDKLLFQGVSAGVHLRPNRYFTLYTTMGASDKTGDTHRSFNRMFGGTWNDVARTGVRADFHYSKFYSNFGNGDYSVLTLSRKVTNRVFWNVQLANQDLLSQHSANYNSRFLSDSFDVNLGRHSYIQSGFTYVDGATMNYRQWYTSWGYRFDQGKSNPKYVETLQH